MNNKALQIAATAAILASFAGSANALAEGAKVNARYTASLAGIPVGKGTWVIDIGDGHYSASASGGTVGLLKAFSSGEGSGSVRGSLSVGGQPVMSTYSSLVKTDKKTDAIKLLVNGGVVKDASVEPPVDSDPERVPVTDAHKRGVLDPMTATIMRVPGTANPLGPDACRAASIFDGRTRYDLTLAYKRMEQVKAEKGYTGPVVVCAVTFKPIAGFIMSRTAVKYLAGQRDMEVWLVPVAGTRVVVPYRVSVPTPIGLAVLEATEFVSTVQSAANTKSQ
jgi:hypothetical protein